jgi:hypothetical protein
LTVAHRGGPENDVKNDRKNSKINSHLQILFGAQFEQLYGKMHGNVKYFVIFCNLVNILDVGAETSNHAVIVMKIEIQGFLQLRNAVAETALPKFLPPFAPHLSGCWARCKGGLFGHAGYFECLLLARTWFKLQTPSESDALATQVFLESCTFAMVCCFLTFRHP